MSIGGLYYHPGTALLTMHGQVYEVYISNIERRVDHHMDYYESNTTGMHGGCRTTVTVEIMGELDGDEEPKVKLTKEQKQVHEANVKEITTRLLRTRKNRDTQE